MRSASALVLGPSFSGHGLWRHKGPVRPGLCVFPPRFSGWGVLNAGAPPRMEFVVTRSAALGLAAVLLVPPLAAQLPAADRSEEHTSELQSPCNLVCRLLLEKKKKKRHKAC